MRRPIGLWILGAVALTVAGGVLYLEGQRRTALERTAQSMGFSFSGGGQRLPDALDRAGFYLFTQGPAECTNAMEGERSGYRLTLLEYAYDAGKGEEGSRDRPVGDVGQSERRSQTVAWLRKPGQTLPDFDLSPTRQALRRVGPVFSMQPFGYDGQAAFRDRYLLFVRDQSSARRVFTPRVLERWASDPGWFVEGRGDQWLVYRLSHRVSPQGVPGFVDKAISLIERLVPR